VQRSLSVLLPVKNAQATLTASVHEILDVAADSGDPFELLIIDDGSTDATSEVAHELTRHYPQVRMVRHGRPLGRDAAIRSGLKRSRGNVVMLRDEQHGFHILEDPTPSPQQASSRPTRPNYLNRLRRFALGE
jgi:glycosyltransferase involved in cell wall biosynthesis